MNELVSAIPPEDLEPYLSSLTNGDVNRRELLLSKAAFPYDYMNDESKLDVRSLPPQKTFYNKLTNEALSDDEYQRAIEIWKEFNCATMKDYMELYVTLDVLLIAAVFETYRQSTYAHFGLEAAHYVSCPGLCFDAMLRLTGVKLDTLSDTDMYLFFTKAIRGGMSGSSVRYARANNQLMNDYDPSSQTSHILSLDANSLYSHSLSCPLPMGEFRWLTRDEIDSLDIVNHSRTAAYGYFLEVDLKYPRELHDLHNEFPLAPEKMRLDDGYLSRYTLNLREKLGLRSKVGGTKLVATLMDKSRYILHYEILKLYLRLGMQILNIYRGIRFRQGEFLKPYITLNNQSRKKATHSFSSKLFKLYNNCVYGKTCFNVFKMCHVELISDPEKFRRRTGQPTFVSAYRVSDNVVSVTRKPAVVVCNKPIYIGATVLDLSKAHMYSFFYDYLVRMYSSRGLHLLYTDTDSFYIQVMNCPNIYRDILEYEEFFDRSKYPDDHFLHSTFRQQSIGLMKDEHAADPIVEMVSLRSKMYSVRTLSSKDEVRAKGLKECLLRKLRFSDYHECLHQSKPTKYDYSEINGRHHHLRTISRTKVGLSPFDDKRFVLPCGIHTLAYGHYKIQQFPHVCYYCDE